MPVDIDPAAFELMRDDSATLRHAESLGESDAQLRLVIDLAGIASWRHDRASGRISLNDLGWAVLDLAPRAEGIAAAELRQLIHPDDLPQLLRLSQRALQGDRPVDIEVRFRRPHHQWCHVLTRCVAQRDGKGRVVALAGVTRDLTERFAQTQREAELSRRLELATSAAGVGVWSLQPSVGETHWDAQMRALNGVSADLVVPNGLGAYLRGHVHPDDRDAVAQGARTLAERRSAMLDLEFRVLRPDGTIRYVSSRTSFEMLDGVATLCGVLLDVTERHESQARLRDANERIALAARGAGMGTWELTPDGLQIWWDEQMFRLRGLPPESLPMSSDRAVAMLHPEDQASFRREVQTVSIDGQPASRDFRVLWPDGNVRWITSRSVLLRDEAGRPQRRIGINWDITQARATAAEREEKLLARRESQAKSQFLARMSHELRTPLNAVLGFAQLLYDEREGEVVDAQKVRELTQARARHIMTAGHHLLGLINEVLDLSSLESGELPASLQVLAMATLIDDVLPMVDKLAEQHEVILTRLRTEACVLADPTRLRQVLINLLSNAIKYNRPNGVATVEAVLENSQVVIRVRDNGRGMNAKQLERLFEPFNRLGAEQGGIEGTGIGLSIVRAAVLHMGGTVHVSSQPDIGSCFEVRLPAVDEGAAHALAPSWGMASASQRARLQAAGSPTLTPTPTPTPAVPLTLPQRRPAAMTGVLYIKDNDINMMIVSELIGQRRDLSFHAAADGQRGFIAACQHLPELILIDMQLPDMDGLQVLRLLRAEPSTAAIRCVALSANAMPADIRTALDAGFAAYWTKPMDFAAFHAALDAQFGPYEGSSTMRR